MGMMNMIKIGLIVICVCFCLCGTAGADETFRCGSQVVRIGDTRDEVKGSCGEPTSVESWEEERIQRDFRSYGDDDPRTDDSGRNRSPLLVKIQVKIQMWTYNLGFNKFIRYLRFENGILKKIKTGEKGY